VQIFNEFLYHWSKGDWWLQLNIDEFYVGNSKAFVPFAVGSIDFSCLSRRLSLCSGLVTSRGRNPAPFDTEMV
jgi:hypothetical protein